MNTLSALPFHGVFPLGLPVRRPRSRPLVSDLDVGRPVAPRYVRSETGGGLRLLRPARQADCDQCGRHQIGELLPLLAKQADKYSIIRSMTHGNNGHETASYMVQTGRAPARLSSHRRRDSLAVQGLRSRATRADPALHRADGTAGPFFRGGLSGSALQALRHRRRSGGQTPFAVEGIVGAGITEQRQRDRREFFCTS